MKIIIYDLEIEKAIPYKNKIEGIEYCRGWDDFKNMGISCLCAYDYYENRYRVFTKSNKYEFVSLITTSELVVGFNNRRFDNQVILKNWGIEILEEKVFDILEEIWKAEGCSQFNKKTHSDYGLNQCVFINFGHEKTGHGAFAPVDWQRGRIGNVIDYCIQDVKLTKMLFEMILKQGFIRSPKNPEKIIEIKLDEKLKKLQ